MKTEKPKLIIIVGPTASGKSELAVRLAKKFNGEIISADSRQIYRGLNIGSGKVPGKWKSIYHFLTPKREKVVQAFFYKNIPHYCIDIVSLEKICTVAEFKQCAEAAIKDIARRGKNPILVGGTGFWIDAVVYNLKFPAVAPDQKLRKKLERKTPKELFTILKKLDPRRAKTVEQKNKRRLIRAIEVAKTIGTAPLLRRKSPYRPFWIGLNPSYETLSRKIKKRAQEMIQKGLVRETRRLLALGISKKRIKELGFEYRAALGVIEKIIPRRDLLHCLAAYTSEYARRQMVWFKRNPEIQWFWNASAARSSKKLYRKLIPSH